MRAMEVTPWSTVEMVGVLYDPEWWASYNAALDAIEPAPEDGRIPEDHESYELQVKYDQYETGILEASWLLRALSGGVVHPAETWDDDYQRHNTRELYLRHQPVAEVLSITRLENCGDLAEVLDGWCWLGGPVVRMGTSVSTYVFGDAGCTMDEGIVRVRYETRDTLPPGTAEKVAWLAWQYQLALTGSSKCQLPERVTSITRQQVTWSMLDPQTFLEQGLTGMARIDAWLSAVRWISPGGRIIDPVKSHLLRSERLTEEDLVEV